MTLAVVNSFDKVNVVVQEDCCFVSLLLLKGLTSVTGLYV